MSSNSNASADKYSLITTGLQEVLGEDYIKEIIPQRPLKVYWGTATTGRPHIGYFVPLVKIVQFLKADCQVTILLADVHAVLDNLKATWDTVNERVQYYQTLISAVLTSLGVPTDRLVFVKGSDYQLSRSYILDVYKLSTLVSQHDARKAGSEVVKQVEHPLLSGLLYPCLQALDEEYLHVDAQFGGVDQRKIFTFAEKYLPHLGYHKRAHLMNPMVPGLSGGKMSSSDADSKIDFLDSPKVVEKKLRKAFCKPGSLEDNGVLSFVQMVVFPLLAYHDRTCLLVHHMDGESVEYTSYSQIEADFLSLKLHPGDLKTALTREINLLLSPIRSAFDSDEMRSLIARAYPAQPVKGVVEMADPTSCEFRVGRITSIKKNDKAHSLFVEQVEVGLGRPLTICSSLVGYCTEEELEGNCFVFMVNLKPANLRGVMSEGMIMCAKGQLEDKLEPLVVPAESQPGDIVYFEGFEPVGSPAQLNSKKKLLPSILADMKVGGDSVVVWKGAKMRTDRGFVKACRVAPSSRVQ